jgi:hypothetical protein
MTKYAWLTVLVTTIIVVHNIVSDTSTFTIQLKVVSLQATSAFLFCMYHSTVIVFCGLNYSVTSLCRRPFLRLPMFWVSTTLHWVHLFCFFALLVIVYLNILFADAAALQPAFGGIIGRKTG